MGKVMRKKAISLVVLAITIIVMIILAGAVMINLADSDIINNANEVVNTAEIKNEKEIIEQAIALAYGSNVGRRLTAEMYETAFTRAAGANAVEAIDNIDTVVVKFNDSNRWYEVDRAGTITGPIINEVDEYAGDITKGGTCDGSETNPYQITCIEDLVAFSIMTNGGNTNLGLTSTNFSGKYLVLTKTLDFKSLFSYEDYTTTKYGDLNTDGITEDIRTELTKKEEGCIGFKTILNFAGTFDGKDHMVENVYMKNTTASTPIAFFRGANCTIKNLSLSGTIINTVWNAAGILSLPGGSTANVINCTNYADVTGYNMVAGIRDYYLYGEVTNCKNYGTINITGISYAYGGAGGIVAYVDNNAVISECMNEGEVTGVSNRAGVLGTSQGATLVNCVNKGKSVAGMIGRVREGNTDIINCYNTGECTNGLVNCYGGAIWNSILELNIYNSYNTGKVTDTGLIGSIGTICAEITLNIENCYNAGESSKAILGSKATDSRTITTITAKNVYYDVSQSTSGGVDIETVDGLNESDIKNNEIFIQTLNNNIGTNTDWKRWKIGDDGYPTFE